MAMTEFTLMPHIARQVRHNVVVSAAGCRIDEDGGQREPHVDQSNRTVLRLA